MNMNPRVSDCDHSTTTSLVVLLIEAARNLKPKCRIHLKGLGFQSIDDYNVSYSLHDLELDPVSPFTTYEGHAQYWARISP
jgi:hypothetical protein